MSEHLVIDVHTHIVPESFPAYTGRAREARWPTMAPCDKPHHKTVMIAGRNFRDVGDHFCQSRVSATSLMNSG